MRQPRRPHEAKSNQQRGTSFARFDCHNCGKDSRLRKENKENKWRGGLRLVDSNATFPRGRVCCAVCNCFVEILSEPEHDHESGNIEYPTSNAEHRKFPLCLGTTLRRSLDLQGLVEEFSEVA